jgi:hypothetical protein
MDAVMDNGKATAKRGGEDGSRRRQWRQVVTAVGGI